MKQGTIDFDLVSNGVRTSDAAAESMRPHASTLRDKVRQHIAANGINGATADEIEHALGLAGNTVRPRLVELRNRHQVCDSGRTRKTVSGRQAIVWINAGAAPCLE